MNPTKIAGEAERIEAEQPRCEACASILLLFATDYVTWNRCINCGRASVIGWVSCQLGMLGAPAGTTATWGAAR